MGCQLAVAITSIQLRGTLLIVKRLKAREKMALKVYNTLTRYKEDFVPLQEGKVLMYSCGPTVYDYFHIGNARTFLLFDMVRRYLEYKGYEVKLVQNITDIDDKIINKANELGISATEIAQKYTEAYLEDSIKLGIRPPDEQPKATEHIPEIISIIQKLQEKNAAYEIDGDVYFRVKKFRDYGKLSKRNLEEMQMGARVDVDERKESPEDFALWKTSKPGEPEWDSPWGKGRPGWHIECSAMSMKYLGETFDIHTGGVDLIFPHHENEIAQSEMATGKPFVKYWLHTAFLQIGGERMGKSMQNYIFVRDALKEHSPEAIRFFLLSAHYRNPLDYTPDSLAQATSASKRLRACLGMLQRLGQSEGEIEKEELNESDRQIYESVARMREQFERAMDDDFNTAAAIGAIFELIHQINIFVKESEGNLSKQSRLLLDCVNENIVELCDVLGIYSPDSGLTNQDATLVDELMKLIIEIRQGVRERKDWDTADKIRDKLKELNIVLKDTREETVWEIE